MHSTRVFSLLTVLTTMMLQMSSVVADCCDCPITFSCNDGTKCTPYCGYGQCNIFGCNCDGGCRSSFQGFSVQKINNIEDASESYFDDADANGDGKLTFDEWFGAAQNKGVSKEDLHKQWAKFDSAGVGHLSKVQAIFRTA
ncbi:hypothetical protein BD779DRAFT_1801744 [Infundibulicybe gibba]|nr:hypothetical protein BD779DRAFT_1801744 [Infundibulicybe gibba]